MMDKCSQHGTRHRSSAPNELTNSDSKKRRSFVALLFAAGYGRRWTFTEMDTIPCFDSSHLEAACKVLADTTMGLKGDEIGYLLKDMGIADPDPTMTKWKQLFNALALTQN